MPAAQYWMPTPCYGGDLSKLLTPRPLRLKLVSPLVTGATSEALQKDDEWLPGAVHSSQGRAGVSEAFEESI